MKLLFYRYGSICEPDIIDAFHQLGLECISYNDEISNKERPLSQSVTLLQNFLLEHPVDFVFSINFFPFVSEVCNIFHIRYLSWTVDSPVMELYSTSIENEWNRTFLFDKAQLEEFQKYNPQRIFHLPLAANVDSKNHLFQSASKEIHGKYAHDVAFVGSLYTEKCPYDHLSPSAPAYLTGYLEGIMQAQENIYGYYFIDQLLTDDMIADFREHLPGFYHYPGASHLTDRDTMSQLYIGNKISAMERVHTFSNLCQVLPVDIYTGSDTSNIRGIRNHGLATSLQEMPLIFHNSKVNLNITSKTIRSGIPLRIFDIMSCGGFVLTNYQPELAELFDCHNELAIYTCQEELMELASYYLSHDARRIEIAANALLSISQKHSYIIRIMDMLELAYSI